MISTLLEILIRKSTSSFGFNDKILKRFIIGKINFKTISRSSNNMEINIFITVMCTWLQPKNARSLRDYVPRQELSIMWKSAARIVVYVPSQHS